MSEIPQPRKLLALESWKAQRSSSTEPISRALALLQATTWRPVMEAFPHHDGVLGPRGVQLHLEILPKHVDSIEGADNGEWELGKG